MPSGRGGRRSRSPAGGPGSDEAREPLERGETLHHPTRLRPGAVRDDEGSAAEWKATRRPRRAARGRAPPRPGARSRVSSSATPGSPCSRSSAPSSASAAQRAVFEIRSRSLAWRTTTSRNGAAIRGIAGHRQNSGGKRQRGQRAGSWRTGCRIYHATRPRASRRTRAGVERAERPRYTASMARSCGSSPTSSDRSASSRSGAAWSGCRRSTTSRSTGSATSCTRRRRAGGVPLASYLPDRSAMLRYVRGRSRRGSASAICARPQRLANTRRALAVAQRARDARGARALPRRRVRRVLARGA